MTRLQKSVAVSRLCVLDEVVARRAAGSVELAVWLSLSAPSSIVVWGLWVADCLVRLAGRSTLSLILVADPRPAVVAGLIRSAVVLTEVRELIGFLPPAQRLALYN